MGFQKVAPEANDKLVDELPSTEVKVVGDSIVFTVTTTSVYVTPEGKNKEVKNAPEHLTLLAIEGDDDKYFPYSGKYTTTRGSASYKEGKETPITGTHFYVTPRDSSNVWNASNGTHTFEHLTTVHFPKVVWVRYNEILNKDITYTFNLKPTLTESTSHPEANVEHEGKTYTMSYASEVTARYEGVEGSASVTNRAYLRNIPDNYTQEFETKEYVGNFSAKEGTFATEDQHNAYVRKTYNNGVLTEEKPFEMPLVLSAKLTRTSGAREDVEEFKNNLGVSMALSGAAQTTFGEPDENGYRAQRVTRNYTLRVSDGARYKLEIIVENTVKNGEDVFDYAWFNAIEPEISLQPKFNASESTASNHVSDVEVSVNLNVARTTRGQLETKAATDKKEPYTIKASHQEVMTVSDEYVPGKDRSVWTVTPSGNGYDITGQLFETYTLSGEREVDNTTGRLNSSLVGKNSTFKTVKNTEYQITGNGWTGTGTVTYTDNADNGVPDDSFQNEYEISADGKLTLTLKGRKGPGSSKTFEPMFTLTEGGQKIISNGTNNGTYTSYTYTNKVDGVYALEGKEVKLSATATRELRVEIPVETILGDIVAAYVSLVPAHKVGTGFAYGDNTQYATECITIYRSNGTAAAIPYAYETEEAANRVPSRSQIENARWLSGYNQAIHTSGIDKAKNGSWEPAKAEDLAVSGVRAIVYTPLVGNKLSVRDETLNQWGWRGGKNYSCKSNDRIVCENGVVTIMDPSGNVLKRFK
ncbi:MAG TPA: hypothetical protein DIC64_03080 [Alphaproteobacteria bacterium]|nr:hypothetical protein [Alphaproteobacteria bacterium]